jgi:tRNA modification GTPase
MTIADSETIFALASGAGRGAIAVLRLSGDLSHATLKTICGSVPAPRRAAVRALRGPGGDLLDKAIVVWLPGPASYTGEDSAELHVHGGPAVVRAVSDALLASGCRPAEPGAFSRRAFLAGRMDLVEAEGVADLVAAETEGQRRQALRQLTGEASRSLADWAARLRRVLAWQEALIDFPDEDLPAETARQLADEIAALAGELRLAAAQAARGQRVREGLVFAVTGPPNVGKSSLVNALARRDVSIVAATPGTTRDALEVPLDLGGILVTLVDTAGLRESTDAVEAEGVRRAMERAASADLVISVVDASAPGVLPAGPGCVAVANKSDLAAGPAGYHAVSAKTGDGIEAFRQILTRMAADLTSVGEHPVLARARHVSALSMAADALETAQSAALPELVGEELRMAMRALGRITGAVGVEDILETVFGAFCIGK